MSTTLMPSTPTVKRSNSYRKALRKSGVYYDPNDEYQEDEDRFAEPSDRPIDFQPIGSKKRFVKRQQQQQQQQQMRNIVLLSSAAGNHGKPVIPHETDDEMKILMNANYPNGGGEQRQQSNPLDDRWATVKTRQQDHFYMETFQQQNERIVLNGRSRPARQSGQTSADKNIIIKDPCDQEEEGEEEDDDGGGGTTTGPPTATTINWKHLFCLFCCCNYCCCLLRSCS